MFEVYRPGEIDFCRTWPQKDTAYLHNKNKILLYHQKYASVYVDIYAKSFSCNSYIFTLFLFYKNHVFFRRGSTIRYIGPVHPFYIKFSVLSLESRRCFLQNSPFFSYKKSVCVYIFQNKVGYLRFAVLTRVCLQRNKTCTPHRGHSYITENCLILDPPCPLSPACLQPR